MRSVVVFVYWAGLVLVVFSFVGAVTALPVLLWAAAAWLGVGMMAAGAIGVSFHAG